MPRLEDRLARLGVAHVSHRPDLDETYRWSVHLGYAVKKAGGYSGFLTSYRGPTLDAALTKAEKAKGRAALHPDEEAS